LNLHTQSSVDAGTHHRLFQACAVLAAVVTAAFVAIAWISSTRHGSQGVVAAAVAAGVCLASGIAALAATAAFRNTPSQLTGVFLAMLLRTGVPLAAAITLTNASPMLARAGLFGTMVVFYLLTLAVETVLSVRLLKSGHDVPRTK
jgi:hypothetical protein